MNRYQQFGLLLILGSLMGLAVVLVRHPEIRYSRMVADESTVSDVPAVHPWSDWDEWPSGGVLADGKPMTAEACQMLAEMNRLDLYGDKGEAKWDGHRCMTRYTSATCEDKSRVLLRAEDKSEHCVKF